MGGVYSQAILVIEKCSRMGTYPVPGGNDSHQVQGIRRRDADNLSRDRGSAHGPKCVHGFRRAKLLPCKPGHEPACSNPSLGFQSPKDPDQIPPGGGKGLALQNIAEHNTPSLQQHPGKPFQFGA